MSNIDIPLDIPLQVKNLETLIEYAKEKQQACFENAGFIDLHEPEILSEADYKQMQYKKYAYAVKKVDDAFD